MTAVLPNTARVPKLTFARLLPILAAIFVAALYAAGSWSNQFVYDDHEVIEDLYPIHSFRDLAQIFREPHYLGYPYYRPITRATFALQKTIWGDPPRPYHLFNAILAAAVFLAAYLLLRRPSLRAPPISRHADFAPGLTSMSSVESSLGVEDSRHESAALLIALFFAVHPAFSECVYPAASGRESLLPALFILLATWAWLSPRRLGYGLALLFFVIALLCKEQAAVLPGIFFIADALALTPRPAQSLKMSGWLARYAPVALIFIAYFFVRHTIFGHSRLVLDVQHHPLLPLLSLLYGLQTAIAPFMELHYEPPLNVWFNPALSAISLLVLLILIGCLLRAKNLWRIALFWLGWFVLLQLPTAHIVRQEADYSERYVALAILAVPALAGAILLRLVRAPSSRRIVAYLAILWIAVFAFLSFYRGNVYNNDISFAKQWLSTNPDSARAHDGLGYVAQQANDSAIAIDQYRRALRLDPDDPTAHNNLANLLMDRGDWPQAVAQYQFILSRDPYNVEVMVNYAKALGAWAYAEPNVDRRDTARDLLERALRARPNDANAHYVLAQWQLAFGSKTAAISQLKKALLLQPGWTEVQQKLQQLNSQPRASASPATKAR